MSKKITVVGIGYVGLSSAVLLSSKNEVVAFDVVQEKVDKLNARIAPIKEKLIEDYLANRKLNLRATTDKQVAFGESEVIIIATPTNYDNQNMSFDTSSIEYVLDEILSINVGALIVIKSTIPIGYVEKLRSIKGYNRIIFSPEFLRESMSLYDNLHPSRIIVGIDKKSYDLVDDAKKYIKIINECILETDIECLIMGDSEAAAVKLFSNNYLAMRVAFFNELDTYAEIKALDAKDIISGVCLDPRIGELYNNPSFGYGGYCLSKDTRQLLYEYSGIPERLMTSIVESNNLRKEYIIANIKKIIYQKETNFKKVVVGIYRLVMKKDALNSRESVMIDVINELQKDYNVVVYEPYIVTSEFLGKCKHIIDLESFKQIANIIIANRIDDALLDVEDKVYSRDIFHCD